jgi:hypothetical protein
MGDNDNDLEIDKFERKARQPVCFTLGAAVFEDEVLPIDIAEIAQPLPKCLIERQ